MIVPRPWASSMIAFEGVGQVHDEDFVTLGDRVSVDRNS